MSGRSGNVDMDGYRLCCEVKKFRIIYDSSMPEHNRRHTVDEAWREIAKTMGHDALKCKRRWENMRKIYCRYLKKIGYSLDGSHGDTKEYKYAAAIEFIRPYLHVKMDYGAPDSSSACHGVQPKLEIDAEADHVTTTTSLPPLAGPSCPSGPPPLKRPRASPPEPGEVTDPRLGVTDPRLGVSDLARMGGEDAAARDDVDMFLMSIAPIMRKVSPRYQLNLRCRMLQLVNSFLTQDVTQLANSLAMSQQERALSQQERSMSQQER